jgi:peptide/nickel transport system permease protein
MTHFILRRLAFIPAILLLANFLGFAYAYYVGPIQAQADPYSFSGSTVQRAGLFVEYWEYLSEAFHGDMGVLHTGETITSIVLRSSAASLALLAIAFVLSIFVGLAIGFTAVRLIPPRVAGWLTLFTTMGLAAPAFYVGILLISLSVFYFIYGPNSKPLLPFQGFGWDVHLVLPALALMVQPVAKIAQVTSNLLVDEMGQQYVIAARSFGNPLKKIRSHHAFRNVIAPVILVMSGSLRYMVAELIIIERLFGWPGIGRLFSSTLILTSRSDNFLVPQLMAALLTLLALLYLVADLIASILVRHYDPRIEKN